MLSQEAKTLEHTPTTGMEVHEGDIFVSSWGYSMTLVDRNWRRKPRLLRLG